jgi:hypothetical protein
VAGKLEETERDEKAVDNFDDNFEFEEEALDLAIHENLNF